MPWHKNSHVQPEKSLGVKHFAPGFSSYFHPTQPTCSPSTTTPRVGLRPTVGTRLPRSDSIAGPATRGSRGLNTTIEGRFYPK
jgi:hypothetical protein